MVSINSDSFPEAMSSNLSHAQKILEQFKSSIAINPSSVLSLSESPEHDRCDGDDSRNHTFEFG